MRWNLVCSAVVFLVLTAWGPQVARAEIAYHAPSDTYYELVRRPPPVRQNDVAWKDAVALADKRTHKRRQGQLAIVDGPELHRFLTETFSFDAPTWIGLRYWCRYRRMMWVNGTTHAHADFQAWANPWHRTQVTCSHNDIPYMPVYYTSRGQWQASGTVKRFMAYLVAYPASEKDG